MKSSSLSKGVILLPLVSNDMLLQLLVGIVRMSAQRSPLLEELKQVDHQYIIIYIYL